LKLIPEFVVVLKSLTEWHIAKPQISEKTTKLAGESKTKDQKLHLLVYANYRRL